jgi:hypothetical protein
MIKYQAILTILTILTILRPKYDIQLRMKRYIPLTHLVPVTHVGCILHRKVGSGHIRIIHIMHIMHIMDPPPPARLRLRLRLYCCLCCLCLRVGSASYALMRRNAQHPPSAHPTAPYPPYPPHLHLHSPHLDPTHPHPYPHAHVYLHLYPHLYPGFYAPPPHRCPHCL